MSGEAWRKGRGSSKNCSHLLSSSLQAKQPSQCRDKTFIRPRDLLVSGADDTPVIKVHLNGKVSPPPHLARYERPVIPPHFFRLEAVIIIPDRFNRIPAQDRADLLLGHPDLDLL